ncbi:SsrA-binding protein [Geotoga petraea]|jgi:SsrA-binding protein|uniref:SsrA-binding protein n=2 Tax=Geotoga petraea TaxID=28234 RepID=A0A1G6HYR5_9BACT|nr:SsrA-binding protein SmpB [Geotoga petraea]MDK2945363.1 SsrA-binding protein [Geotoga sp.]TGG89024.1 SsrA-binding protein SmpB [Geotoga petraea]SDB99330.1 SsrA-binding protein [Geotoga petraea]
MKIIVNNKKARHDYFIEETYQAGIELLGSEVKSIKDGRINLKDSYAKIKKNEIFLYNVNIAPYKQSAMFNHEPERPRKLLLHKNEIIKINQKIKQDKCTIIPLKVYVDDRGLIKVDIAIAKGKKKFDKRETIAKRDFDRKMRKVKKYDRL